MLSRASDGKAVLKESTANLMTDMLQEAVSSGTGNIASFAGQEIAGNSGSNTIKSDQWFVGYTPYYTAAVWSGFDTHEQVNAQVNFSASLWKQVMERAHEGLAYKSFTR